MTTKNILALFEPQFGVCAVRPTVDLVPVESSNSDVERWYELRIMKLPLVKIICWSEKGAAQRWELTWPGPDAYKVTDVVFLDPVSAAGWFYLQHMKEPTT
jgi:hypothetical protein